MKLIELGKIGKAMYGKISLFLLIVCLFAICAPFSYLRADQKKNVLVLHSYHKGLEWNDHITQGIESALHDRDQYIELYFEYMDSKRIYDRQYLQHLYELYRYKYRNRRFDVIISSDDHAFEFLLAHHQELFSDTPIVFCGVNNFEDSMLSGHDLITGVVESFDIKGTFEVALQLQPGIKQMFVIVDKTLSSKIVKEMMMKEIPPFENVLRFTFLEDLDMSEVLERVKNLPTDSVVFLISFVIDKSGNTFSFERSCAPISQNSAAPIYSHSDAYLGHGIVGGKLNCGGAQGQLAGEMALRILHGEKATSIPVIKKSPNRYMFDYQQMQRFGIKPASLPEGSIVINRPHSFYSKYKRLVWSVVACLSGLVLIILILSTNIITRRRAEKALRESEDRYRSLVENIELGITLIDSDYTILMTNAAQGKLFNKDVNDFVGKKCFQEFEKRENVCPHCPGTQTMATGQPAHAETRGIRDDGSRFNVHLNTFPTFSRDGSIIGFIEVVEDITEKKQAEEALRESEARLQQSQKMESIGTLAGGIAHDFNNILTTILCNVSLAKTQVTSEDELFEMLSEAEMASLRAQTLTKQLLTFAKGGAPVKETASIKDILKESSSFVLRGSKSNCELSIADGLWPAEVDVGQMSQVINNIVINANQAMPGGGIIQVAAENLIVEDRHGLPVNPGRYIKISIKDQGVSIAEKHLSNIFDPYFTTKQEGSGLGLATAYSIIKKHDGHITVESQLGVGTTFHIYLPASDKAIPEKEKVKVIKGQGRVLVMDDEASLRKVVGRMLAMLGYEAEFAKDGAEAIRMVKEAKEAGKPYDAVILDLTIPGGMGGKEVINKLLEIDPEVKAIVSSGYSDDPVLSNFQEYGFKGMMPKPFQSQLLSKVIHEVLHGEKE